MENGTAGLELVPTWDHGMRKMRTVATRLPYWAQHLVLRGRDLEKCWEPLHGLSGDLGHTDYHRSFTQLQSTVFQDALAGSWIRIGTPCSEQSPYFHRLTLQAVALHATPLRWSPHIFNLCLVQSTDAESFYVEGRL